jgi:glycosyltransferase involved in cell wall biosynthesis
LQLIRLMKQQRQYSPVLLISNGLDIPLNSPDLGCPTISLDIRNPISPESPLRAALAFCFWLPLTLRRLRTVVKEHNIHVINYSFPDAECLNLILLKRLGLFSGKVILWLHGSDIKLALDKTGMSRILTRLMFRLADRVIACSQGIVRQLLRLEPRCRANSVVVYNGIDSQVFQAKADWDYVLPERLRAAPFLLNVGRFQHTIKGQDILIKAFRRLASKFPDLLLVMIGGSVEVESEEVRGIVRASNLEHRIVMLENVPHERIAVFLKAARLFVLPSRREGLPIAILEAGVWKAPVVAAACVGVTEVVEDRVNGRLVPVDDAEALATAISELLLDDVESRRLGENLYRSVTEQFTLQRAYEDLAGL